MVSIANIKLGMGNPCFIVFEAGPTHSGIVSAKRLANYAKQAGANAIKFQIFDPDRLVQDKKQLFGYEILLNKKNKTTKWIEEPLYDILKRRCLPFEQWQEIKTYCDDLGIAFFATVGFEEDVILLEKLNCDSIKIASADINHLPLIRRVAQSGISIQIDTGMATLGEIEQAVNTIESEGNSDIIIHQCPSGYPAHLESINLKMIATLKQMFPHLAIAFSDHTPGWNMDIAAVALGVDLVEKTITEDSTTPSVEHIMSLEPSEMKDFIVAIRELEIALGNTRRISSIDESKRNEMVRRSIFIKENTEAGTKLSETELDFRRPGDGISVVHYDFLKAGVLAKNVKAGHKLALSDLTFL